MGKGIDQPKTDEVPVEEEELSTPQEAVPWPAFAGEQQIAIRWLSEATNMITKRTKQPAGKK